MEGRQTAVEKVVEGVGPILTSTNEKHFEHLEDPNQPWDSKIRFGLQIYHGDHDGKTIHELWSSGSSSAGPSAGWIGCFGCSTLRTGTADFLSIAWLRFRFPPNQEALFAWASPSDDLGDLQQKNAAFRACAWGVWGTLCPIAEHRGAIPESDEPDARLALDDHISQHAVPSSSTDL